MSFSPLESDKAKPTSASSWTPDRQAMACRLYLDEGLSASEVAKALGGGLTRGAVIGKIHRLGFAKRQPRAGGDADRASRAARDRRVGSGRSGKFMGPSWPPQPLPPLREAPLQGRPAVLADLVEGACRWPIDDPGPSRMYGALFCAAPTAGDRYCAAHRAIAAAPTPTAADAPALDRRRAG
jgi:GcrA cell cycle regulator